MKRVMLVGLMLALAGCDYFPGPRISSRLDSDAHAAIQYSDGTTSSFTLKPCTRYIIGRANSSVVEVEVTQQGALIVDLDDDELQQLEAEQEVEDATLVEIYATSDGPTSIDPDPKKCPSQY